MKAVIFAAGLTVAAGQVSALDCIFQDAAFAFGQAADNGEVFHAAIGQIAWSLPEDVLHHGGLVMEYEGQTYDVIARFTGELMMPGGVREPIDQNLRVKSMCINGDCGYAYSGANMITFVHETADGPVMFAYPCQSYPKGVSPEDVALIQSCLDGGPCDTEMRWD